MDFNKKRLGLKLINIIIFHPINPNKNTPLRTITKCFQYHNSHILLLLLIPQEIILHVRILKLLGILRSSTNTNTVYCVRAFSFLVIFSKQMENKEMSDINHACWISITITKESG